MINVLIPLGGLSTFFDSDEYPFPKPLIEINGKLMIEMVIENYAQVREPHRFIFIVPQNDCKKYHLDDTLNLLTDSNCEIVLLGNETKGAACSALMAIDHIDSGDKLLISNGDQFIDADMNEVFSFFDERGSDGGVISFRAVHPKWSYVRLDEKGEIVETAEKRPISNNAIAGFYYFRHGTDFVRSAMRSIEKDASVNGIYYISPTLNEMVLENKKLDVYRIDTRQYYSFYSPQKIKEFEKAAAGQEVKHAER
jgi:NDP-sugar pyrophosphorylase family protein